MITLHVVDAFTDEPFTGNPAAVCVRETAADEAWMQRVAREMNLSETAFLHPVEGGFSLRWFTPVAEVPLCGHATLASAHALWQTGRLDPEAEARFFTLSGPLTCRRDGDMIAMDFPATPPEPMPVSPELTAALGVEPVAAARADVKWLAELADESAVRSLRPDFGRFAALPAQGVIVTARSDRPEFDFVSRFFAPSVGVPEDPVTGSAHCALGPYWASRLGRDEFRAWQASARGGRVDVRVRGVRVELRGQAVLVSRVEMLVG